MAILSVDLNTLFKTNTPIIAKQYWQIYLCVREAPTPRLGASPEDQSFYSLPANSILLFSYSHRAIVLW